MTGPIRLGDYREALANVQPMPGGRWLWDTVITDPPFGARTHEGARTCADHDTHGVVDYQHWRPADVHDFVSWAVPRTRRWIAAMTSHDLIEAYEDAYKAVGWYHFVPVPIVISGMGVRRQGDGPSSWSLYLMRAANVDTLVSEAFPDEDVAYLMVARARGREIMANPASNGTALWRTTPGAYWWSPNPNRRGQGYDKPIAGLKEIVGDYSNPGDTICDPFSGYGSTLVAGVQLGRKVIGSEIVPAVAKEANAAVANTAKWMKRNAAKAAKKESE